jgi:hypothetical protein
VQPNQEQPLSSVQQPVINPSPEQQSSAPITPGGVNPFTGGLNRKGYLVWNIAITVVYYGIHFSFNSDSALIIYYIAAAILGLLLVIRRLQNTGLNMLLLLALLLPFANIALVVALFFIPPSHSAPGVSKPGASRGFKIMMSIALLLFIIFALIILRGLLF